MIDCKFIKANLNVSDTKLTEIINKALNLTAKLSGDSVESILEAAKEDVDAGVPNQMINLCPKAFRTESHKLAVIVIDYMAQEFNTTHYHISPETLEWGGFMSHDIFTTTDTVGLDKAVKWVLA